MYYDGPILEKQLQKANLVAAAKKQLQFLEVVDNNGQLYDGPILEKSILRYKNCWLPLLAQHTKSEIPECQLIVPLDCEWIWHCHRFNPVHYMVDCKELFGRILDAECVISSIEGASKKITEEIWKKNYPNEPYELDIIDPFKNDSQSKFVTLKSTNYDLISAVKRQSSFYHKVSRNIMRDDQYLEEAVQRYKGFLHMVKRKMEMKLKNASVPTYDIDLMWHSHQLHPLSYYKDTLVFIGKVLQHDDTHIDRSKGGRLDVGFKTTTKQWGDLFGLQYLKAGMSSGMTDLKGEKLAGECTQAFAKVMEEEN